MLYSREPTILEQDLCATRAFIHNHHSMIVNPVVHNPVGSLFAINGLFLKYPSYHQKYLEVCLLEELTAQQPLFYQFFDIESGYEMSILSVVVRPYLRGHITSLLVREALKEMVKYAQEYDVCDVYLSYLGCTHGAIEKPEFFAILKNFLRENPVSFQIYLCQD